MPENNNQQKKLKGAEKAAILLSLLPEEEAAKIFRYLKDHEIERLVKQILTIETPSKEVAKAVLEEAYETLKELTPLKIAPENIKKVLEKALPPDKLEKLLTETMSAEEGRAIFREIEKMDPKFIANVIKNEHPQVIALILSQINPNKAADIIQFLPKRLGVTNLQEEVIKRIASIEKISHDMVKVVADTLEEELMMIGAGREETLSGLDVAAEIVNILPKELTQEILDEIRKENASLADAIEERMFKFEDIVKLDNRAIIEILKVVDKNDLLIALKGAPPEIMEKFTSNMSKRAAQMFLEDMEVLGPVKKSEVEKARKKIIATIKGLIEKGIIEYGSGEEMI
ncbi:MAG: flagellar motor switch protein FliG [Aquificota bacterium]|nr:MAG: flagellar motor switch protein FliG [Aquificota bacterium]